MSSAGSFVFRRCARPLGRHLTCAPSSMRRPTAAPIPTALAPIANCSPYAPARAYSGTPLRFSAHCLRARRPAPAAGFRVSARAVANTAAGKQSPEKSAPLPDEADFTAAGPAASEMSWPTKNQRTLNRSFNLGGIGLHSGEFALVRVRPAFAGEGRYFVRVPEGTIGKYDRHKQELVRIDEQKEDEVSDEEEERRLQLFTAWLDAKEEEGYEGGFEEYVMYVAREPTLFPDFGEDADDFDDTPEEILGRSENDTYLMADLDNTGDSHFLCTTLEKEGMRVRTVEHLLSALEAHGIDNARIEMEGGEEVPLIDGSAMGWCIQIAMSGVRDAPQASGSEEPTRKMAMCPQEVVSVRDGDKFITFYPGDKVERITYGIDFSDKAEVIGKQWFSWAWREDEHYSIAIGPARTFVDKGDVYELRRAGYIRGGAQESALISDGKFWIDTTMLRFPIDEPVRHKILDLIGDISLLAKGGNQGLPVGHIVAYKAGHEMHIKFAKALRAACESPECWQPAERFDFSVRMQEAVAGAEAAAAEEEAKRQKEAEEIAAMSRATDYDGAELYDEEDEEEEEEEEDDEDYDDDEDDDDEDDVRVKRR